MKPFQVDMPKTIITDKLPVGPTCTLLMALCLSQDQDTTSLLRGFLETFSTEIDLGANHFSAIVLYTSRLNKPDRQTIFQRVSMVHNCIKEKCKIRDLTALASNRCTALHHALECETSEFENFVTSVGQHIDPNVVNTSKRTILIEAAKEKDDKLMIIHRAFGDRYDPNIQDDTGHTCLMYAVLNQSPDVIRAMLRHPDIDPNIQNMSKETIAMLV